MMVISICYLFFFFRLLFQHMTKTSIFLQLTAHDTVGKKDFPESIHHFR